MAGINSLEEFSKTPPVRIGDSITIQFLDTNEIGTYTISLFPSDPPNGILNHKTALAKAILGQETEKSILVNASGETYSVKILSVTPELRLPEFI